MERYLETHIKKDLKEKMVFLAGPRQVGKTTVSKQLGLQFDYLNFDSVQDRRVIIAEEWARSGELVILDEIHKMKKWKSWIKGIYDTEGNKPAFLLTGSARLDVYRKGGDSLAGRHFSYRLHPFSVKEASRFVDSKEALERILVLGGFPEPFLKNDQNFSKRWRRRHLDTVLREDLFDLEKVRDIKSIELMVSLLRERVGSTVSCSSLARDLQVSSHTVKKWLQILENLYIIFPVRPYHKNVARSILKDSKYYFYDTGNVECGEGGRLENAVACSLLAELHFLEDTTGSRVDLCFLRDKEKREVDFLVLVDNRPLFLIEVKLSDNQFSKSLSHFKKYFPDSACIQLVHNLARSKSTRDIEMVSAHGFLKDISFFPEPIR